MKLPDNEFDKVIKSLLVRYKVKKKPIQISFKKIVPDFSSERTTHLIHTYPAKLIGHIPYFFVNCNYFSKKGDLVLDPFCGSGTVLLESITAGRNAVGADSNPLARLISRVKTYQYKIDDLRNETLRLSKSIKSSKKVKVPDVVNVDYWFYPHVKRDLSIILQEIKSIKKKRIREFFLVCFSNCVKKVSLADPRISVPVKLRKDQYHLKHPLRTKTTEALNDLKLVNVKKKFFGIVKANIKRHVELSNLNPKEKGRLVEIYKDSRDLSSKKKRRANSVNLIISSPPYAGAQKYIRASSLNLGWLELASISELKLLEELNIGREAYSAKDYSTLLKTNIPEADSLLQKIWKINPLRAHIAANYLIEMRAAFKECVRVLKPEGHFILVAANNVVCGKSFRTQEFLSEILGELGLKQQLRLIDHIKSYGLMTKRNKTASIITREWITVFKK